MLAIQNPEDDEYFQVNPNLKFKDQDYSTAQIWIYSQKPKNYCLRFNRNARLKPTAVIEHAQFF